MGSVNGGLVSRCRVNRFAVGGLCLVHNDVLAVIGFFVHNNGVTVHRFLAIKFLAQKRREIS